MIIGTGIDVVELGRMSAELARGEWAPDRGPFTPSEVRYCNSQPRPAQSYAALFAAKEAALKALGAEIPDLAIFREAEVTCGDRGPQSIALHGRLENISVQLGARHINLSTVVGKKFAGAIVILEA